jgi:predicted transcriptional regulator
MMQRVRSTFTIDKEVVDELNSLAKELGEKKSHIVEKALTMYYDYLDVAVAEKRLNALEEGKSEMLPADAVYEELGIR